MKQAAAIRALLRGVTSFESDFIGDLDTAAADFKTLLHRIGDAAKTLPPSQVPRLDEIPAMMGALLAWLEHGDQFLTATTKGAVHTAAVLGRQDISQVSATIAADLRAQLAAVFQAAHDAGIDLGATPAPATAAPASPAAAATQLSAADVRNLQALLAAHQQAASPGVVATADPALVHPSVSPGSNAPVSVPTATATLPAGVDPVALHATGTDGQTSELTPAQLAAVEAYAAQLAAENVATPELLSEAHQAEPVVTTPDQATQDPPA